MEEAKKTVDLWYNERKEVRTWQNHRKTEAEIESCVRTMLGRARRFPSMKHATRAQKGHIERAAINTPVQVCSSTFFLGSLLRMSNLKPVHECWSVTG